MTQAKRSQTGLGKKNTRPLKMRNFTLKKYKFIKGLLQPELNKISTSDSAINPGCCQVNFEEKNRIIFLGKIIKFID
ncbi:MAG: hypothetical protein LBP22_01710 [Deltaproteobacteria bacterium]|jgi:hypothetical protein|nr:hypothetical protein [Deltaproteobacteria bacterium]